MAEELTFHLEDFDGPLELLLALVAKHKMDLHNIPILELIDQYTRTVEQADPDPETASAFIEMAAHLVEMKSYLLLPRSEEGERMKQEFTGQLIEYDQCRRMAALLRAKGEQAPVFVRQPMEMEWDNTYTLHHAPQIMARLLELFGDPPSGVFRTRWNFRSGRFSGSHYHCNPKAHRSECDGWMVLHNLYDCCFFRTDFDGARHYRRVSRKNDSDSEPHAAVYCAGNH